MSETTAPTIAPLAAGFAQAKHEQWLALVEKALKGADFEKRLVARTADGLKLQPLYTSADTLMTTSGALPGVAPFTRGTAKPREGFGWDIRTIHVETDAKAANAAILEDLEGGASSVLLQIAAPGWLGLPSEDLRDALDGVLLDVCPVALMAGVEVAEAAGELDVIWRDRKIEPAQRRAAFNANPLGTLALTGGLDKPLDKSLAEAVALIRATAASPGVTVLASDGHVHHVGGATEAQELAAILATFVAYLRAAEADGIAPMAAFPKIAVTVAVDDDQFLGIAKLRAARRLLWRIADATGAGEAAGQIAIAAETSFRMMAKRDPWTNMLRTTVACAAAGLGGADSVTVLPYTWALGKPDRFARRIARNTHIVLQEESSLGKVADPAGGSWYVEKLTAELAKKAWEYFQDIEAHGGMGDALVSGYWQDTVAKSAETRAKAVAAGKIELTGVSAFPLLGSDGVTVEPWPDDAMPADASGAQVKPLTVARLAEPFEALRDAADARKARTGSYAKVFMASLGVIADHTVRSTWVKNYLAAGGIEAIMSDGFATAEAAAAAFAASGVKAACISSSDQLYAAHAEATARALKAAGAAHVLLAGRPGEREAALRAAGVDSFLSAGQDAVATLKALQEKLA